MRDHRRILGSLFIGWAIIQVAMAIFLAVRGTLPSTSTLWATAWLLVTGLVAAVYAWLGIRLRAHDPRVRIPGVAFSALALVSFPFGTALGGYGLWVLLRRPREVAA